MLADILHGLVDTVHIVLVYLFLWRDKPLVSLVLAVMLIAFNLPQRVVTRIDSSDSTF
jgi:hypothetical protein